jgi:hydrogenase maturation protein HypF
MIRIPLDIDLPQRLHIEIQGAVQGVGFRPFVFHLGRALGLSGFVCNSPCGVTIEAQGSADQIKTFLYRLESECPAPALIQDLKFSFVTTRGEDGFEIFESQTGFAPQAVILPDLATCSQCLTDIGDPSNRRYLYPFTNCTHCGPRYSIIEHLPYDRSNTSMKKFAMCLDCQREYHDPQDRRFHAQPNACPSCGPILEMWDREGNILARGQEALSRSVHAVRDGKIVAVKSLGGFQLVVDACQPHAVRLLRERKFRQQKPLAMMFSTLSDVREYCYLSTQEESALISPQAPIVLLAKRKNPLNRPRIAAEVSFDQPRWGIMLPYTPLHHVLMKEMNSPVVATSGNCAQEPMCIDNDEALKRLGAIADVFLVHDRPILRTIDDSVVMEIQGRVSSVRRARGYAPFPIIVEDSPPVVLALGGQMKNVLALKIRDKVYLSQHIGDLDSPEAVGAFTQAVKDLRGLYPSPVEGLAFDLHPDYFSTRFAAGEDTKKMFAVQHHHAHIASCMAEHQLQGPVLGLAWDGTGLGDDQTIWGSEFLLATMSDFQRVGHLWPFRIPGGDSSILQPKRTALGLLAELTAESIDGFKDLVPVQLFSELELKNIELMLSKGIRSVVTTSMGRLFDGVSSLLGLCQESNFEGQAAMALENILGEEPVSELYSWPMIAQSDHHSKLPKSHPYILDWRVMLKMIIDDIRGGESSAIISAKFHNTLVEMAVDVAKRVDHSQVVLSGGCFQNKYLTQRLIGRLKQEGFEPYWHWQVPANDGGLALGQAVIAVARWKQSGGKTCV